MYLVAYVLILVGLLNLCEAARILAVFPTPSISHQVVFRPLTRELAARGHEVVIITTDPAYPKGKTPPNITEIDVHDLSYELWREAVLSSATTTGKSDDSITQMWTWMPLLSRIFELQMRTEEVQKVMNNRTNHFDLILQEACVGPAIGVSYVFKVPVVFVSSLIGVFRNYDVLGAPRINHFLYPTILSQSIYNFLYPTILSQSIYNFLYPTILSQRIYNLTLSEKLREIYRHYSFERLFEHLKHVDNGVLRRLFGPDIPSVTELENDVDLMILNAHPIWDLNRPVPPNIVYAGGMHEKPTNALPEDLKSYLDSSKHGVVYVSFGTNVDPAALPAERIQIMVKAFSKLPYDVLWKWSKDELPGRTPNIRISKWLPQSDLLKHPKIKLFITQGGLQSTEEAIIAGVPLIGMPMLGDQWFNIEHYVIYKIGLRLDLESLTEDALLEGINAVANDDSYRKNIIKLRNIIDDQPMRALDRAIWWIEHVMRRGGGRHLRPRVANMSWTEYLDLELMTVLGLALVSVLGAICVALYLVVGVVKKLSSGSKLKSS